MGEFIATRKNISRANTTKLINRLEKINRYVHRELHPEVKSELLKEKELILAALKDRKVEVVVCEQLDMGYVPKTKSFMNDVVDELKQYKSNLRELNRYKKQLEHGIEIVFPSNVAHFELTGIKSSSTENPSKTESAIIQREQRIEQIMQRIQQLETDIEPVRCAIERLNEEEKKLLTLKYLDDNRSLDIFIMQEMGVGKTLFYEMRKKRYAV